MTLRSVLLFCFFHWSVSNFGFQTDGSDTNHLQNEDFELVKDVHNIKIYHKVNRKKGYIEYKATTILDESDMERVLNFFVDYQSHPLWVYNCIESNIEKHNGKTYLYQICKSPWPLKNRDLSVAVETQKIDNSTVTVNFVSRPNALEKNTGNVRIEDFYSSWLVQQLKDKVMVTVYASFDPKLSMGNFMLKSYTTKIPFETLKNLKALYPPKM
ncbi:hypothetical protein [Flagellimonas sp.]|uniref:hypothetical protein n=1 Tax=Flagellimonas sp. TaxID=2058762 RepID=UPI003B5A5949